MPSNVKRQVEGRKDRYARYLCNFPSENMTGAIIHVPRFDIYRSSLYRGYAYLVPSGFMFVRLHKWHSHISSHGHCRFIEYRIADSISNMSWGDSSSRDKIKYIILLSQTRRNFFEIQPQSGFEVKIFESFFRKKIFFLVENCFV